MKMLEACLNWKVLASLGVAGVAIYLVAPRLVATALPLVLLAACPLSMVLMMWGMQRTPEHGRQTTQEPDVGLTGEERIARLREQQAVLADRLGELEQEETRPAEKERGR